MESLTKRKLYHELLQMSPAEVEAIRESAKQIIGMPASPEWGALSVTKPVVHHGHYRRYIGMPTGHDMAQALQRDTGSGLFDALKHGFNTVVKNARKFHSVLAPVVRTGKDVANFASTLPVIGKYAGKAASVLQGAEKALETAEQGIRIAEGLDRRINPVPAIVQAPQLEPGAENPLPEGQVFGRIPPRGPRTEGQFGAGFGGALRGAGVPGGSLPIGAYRL